MIAIRFDGEIPRVEAIGPLTEAEVSTLQTVLWDLADSKPEHVIVDLRNAVDIHPTALGVLIGAERKARTRGARLAVCAGPRVIAAWESLGLGGIIPTFASVRAAVGAGEERSTTQAPSRTSRVVSMTP